MFLYYTSLTAEGIEQVSPYLSLGGFKSASKVDNGMLNNMFSDISLHSISNKNQNRYIGLVLKNETAAPLTNVKMWFEHPADSYSILKMDVIDMALNSAGVLQMESIRTINSKPLYADFVEATVDSKYDVGGLAVGEQIGVWIEMELLIDFIKTDMEEVAIPDPANTYRYLEKPKNTQDLIKLKISWD